MTDVERARRIRGLIDLTDLSQECSAERIDRLCSRAVDHQPFVPAVCVWPEFVAQAAQLLEGTGVQVATVVNFPAGGTDASAAVAETVQARAAGADEIDLVLPYRAFLEGDVDAATDLLSAVRAAVVGPARLKVILETGEYPSQAAVRAGADLAIAAGADFVKTSTGKTERSASPEAMRTLLEAVRDSDRPVGVKPSGGIRTISDADVYLRLADDIMGAQWVAASTFRFGASGLLDDVDAVLDAAAGRS